MSNKLRWANSTGYVVRPKRKVKYDSALRHHHLLRLHVVPGPQAEEVNAGAEGGLSPNATMRNWRVKAKAEVLILNQTSGGWNHGSEPYGAGVRCRLNLFEKCRSS